MLRHFAGETARTFLNVPYCAPPLGSLRLRFREPQPPLPWDGTRDATAYGKEPVQKDEGRLPFQVPRGDELDEETGLPAYMGEDSLSLNVFTPVGEPSGGPLPVLFYIYGGGFKKMVFGDGNVATTTLRQNPRAAELAAWAGFRRLPAAGKL